MIPQSLCACRLTLGNLAPYHIIGFHLNKIALINIHLNRSEPTPPKIVVDTFESWWFTSFDGMQGAEI